MSQAHPILFSDAMVSAILEGKKTQTRRPVKDPIDARVQFWIWEDGWGRKWETHPRTFVYAAPFAPGEILKATFQGQAVTPEHFANLRVKRVWVERVQAISEADAIAEGLGDDSELSHLMFDACGRFQELFRSIYETRYSWHSNPWVWCCEFEVVK